MRQNKTEQDFTFNLRKWVFICLFIFITIVLIPKCCLMCKFDKSQHFTKGRLNDIVLDTIKLRHGPTYKYEFYVNEKKYIDSIHWIRVQDTFYYLHYRRKKYIGKEIIVRYEPIVPLSFNEIDWERTDSLYNNTAMGGIKK